MLHFSTEDQKVILRNSNNSSYKPDKSNNSLNSLFPNWKLTVLKSYINSQSTNGSFKKINIFSYLKKQPMRKKKRKIRLRILNYNNKKKLKIKSKGQLILIHSIKHFNMKILIINIKLMHNASKQIGNNSKLGNFILYFSSIITRLITNIELISE